VRSHRGPIKGRGTAENPPNRFDKLVYEDDPDVLDPEAPGPSTQYLRDTTKAIIATNQSPDVGFDASVNPYRGCLHGCSYCFARPTHEYLGFSAGVDFESKIMVKEDAPALLRRELSSPRWKPQTLGLSGVTDPYQPIEKKLGITRGCLEVLTEFRNPVAVITKNHLVTRDVDLLAELARHHAAAVFVSVTTLRPELQQVLEPRASPPSQRLRAIETLAKAGVPVGTLVAPVIPALTDHEIPAILEAVARAGAGFASYVILRLPWAVKDLFSRWLEDHAPERKERVLSRIRDIRDGKLNDPNFGSRMHGSGPFADEVDALFTIGCRKARLPGIRPTLSAEAFRRPGGTQLTLL
jgi:DNA repair photolyase